MEKKNILRSIRNAINLISEKESLDYIDEEILDALKSADSELWGLVIDIRENKRKTSCHK